MAVNQIMYLLFIDSLNPCCNGSSPDGPTKTLLTQLSTCLNPCCNGSSPDGKIKNTWDREEIVLILVVMDHRLMVLGEEAPVATPAS